MIQCWIYQLKLDILPVQCLKSPITSMRPPIQPPSLSSTSTISTTTTAAASVAAAAAPTTSTTPTISSIAFKNISYLPSKLSLHQIDVHTDSNQSDIGNAINYSKTDAYLNNGIVTSSIRTPSTSGNTVEHVKNVLFVDNDCQIVCNTTNDNGNNNHSIGTVNRSLKFNENYVSYAKITARHCDSPKNNDRHSSTNLQNYNVNSGQSKSKTFSDSEISPLLERDINSSISLVKNNSASLIFTKKEYSPVVHRNKTANKIGINSTDATQEQRRSLQFNSGYNLSNNNTTGLSERKKHAKSWYASVYSTLDEVAELDLKDSTSNCNLACTKNQHINGLRESASLLEGHQPQPQILQSRLPKASIVRTSNLSLQNEGPLVQTTGGPSPPKYNRFEQLLKSLVGRKVSKDASQTPLTSPVNGSVQPMTAAPITTAPAPTLFQSQNMPLLIASPEIRISKSPSEHNLIRNGRPPAASTTSLNSVQQRLWSVMPLLRREGSCTSLQGDKTHPTVHHAGMKKCQTVLALSRSSNNLEPIKPLNRLRHSPSMATCSRCSSLLSLAANGSRYSLNLSHGGFMPIGSSCATEKSTIPRSATQSSISPSGSSPTSSPTSLSTCKLCLADVSFDKITKLTQCGCEFCTECMKAYVEFEISEGAYEISCPDALCPAQGALTIENEITQLVSSSLLEKHQRYRLNREVELDQNRTWCPRAGCETICLVDTDSDKNGTSPQTTVCLLTTPVKVRCPTCVEEFCSACKKPWHASMNCEENARRLAADGLNDSIGIPFDSDLIKCCPMCAVPIEKDEGCAQMMCKRCKHVFCWYCLESLDDDFLLRHYDKGPCKNKLGHSRASVVWHRAQVIGIFAGFGILLLVASPLLLLAAPCIVCCKCRMCSSSSKLDDGDGDFDEPTMLNR